MALHFWKYHGLGNDFVVVEGGAPMAPGRAVAICDRHRGIGADGVLGVLPARDGGAARMHIFNPDGSVAAMCGNGIRCVARHLAETRALDGEIVIETDSGPRTCTVHRGPAGVDSVTVEMGRARIEGTQEFVVGVERVRTLRVSMGNPHAVILDGPDAARAGVLGPAIEALVPGGVNVGFGQRRRVLRGPRGLGAGRRPHRGLRHGRLRRGGGRAARGAARRIRPGDGAPPRGRARDHGRPRSRRAHEGAGGEGVRGRDA